jgi:ATP-binding cassette, subfamily B, bacterial MsbA
VINFLCKDFSKGKLAFLGGFILLVNMLDLLGLSLFIPILESLRKDGETPHLVTQYFASILGSLGISPSLPWYLIFLCVLFIVKAGIVFQTQKLSIAMAGELQHNFRVRLLGAFSKSTLDFVNTWRQGSLLSTINEHTLRAANVFNVLVQAVLLWLTALVYGLFVILVSWELTLALFVIGLLIIPLIKIIGKLAHTYGDRHTSALEEAQHFALETLQAKKSLNAMGWGNRRMHAYQSISNNVNVTWQGQAFWSMSPSIFIQPFSVIIISVIIYSSVHFALSVPMLGAFVMALLRLLPTIQGALNNGASIKANLPSVYRVRELQILAENAEEPSGNRMFTKLTGDIVLERVQFSYAKTDTDHAVLKNINMVIQRGHTTALVGTSGSGKTTIADLILGLYQPTQGSILVGGSDLQDIDLDSYRSKIAYISQEPFLFHDTIRANLMVGLKDIIDDAELQEICTKAGAWEFIVERHKGLDTIIGDRGVQLSGGQRQRLALARALLRRSELLILDEATSALDKNSEKWIQKSLEILHETKELTMIIIAHRYTTIRHADVIYEVRDGQAKCLGDWNTAGIHLNKEAVAFDLA